MILDFFKRKIVIYSTIFLLLIIILVEWNFVKSNHNDLTDTFSITEIVEPLEPTGSIYFTTNRGGFNNQLQQLWMFKLIAKLSNRKLVRVGFHPQHDDFTFKPLDTYIHTDKFLDGWPSITAAEFNTTCGDSSYVIAKPPWGIRGGKENQIRDLVHEIQQIDNPCLMVTGLTPSYYYYWSKYFLNDYPDIFEKSLKNFELTPLVVDAAHKFKTKYNLDNKSYLSIHLRRGDFEKHCVFLESFSAASFSFNQLFGKFPAMIPDMPYRSHCFPSMQTVVDVIDHLMNKIPSEKPDTIFLMHNANTTELFELLPKLNERFNFVLQYKHDNTDRNDRRAFDGTHGMLVEMILSSESDYFIGNFHSTVTSNVIAIREIQQKDRKNVYFW